MSFTKRVFDLPLPIPGNTLSGRDATIRVRDQTARAVELASTLRFIDSSVMTSLSMWIALLICGRLLTFFRPPSFH